MISIFNRFQFPVSTKGSKKNDMGNCPYFNTSLDGIFQHRAFVQAGNTKSHKEFFTLDPFRGLGDLFSFKISCN